MTHDHILDNKKLDALMNGLNEDDGLLSRLGEFDMSAPSKEASKEVQQILGTNADLANNDKNNEFTMGQVTGSTKLEPTEKVSNDLARDAMSDIFDGLGISSVTDDGKSTGDASTAAITTDQAAIAAQQAQAGGRGES